MNTPMSKTEYLLVLMVMLSGFVIATSTTGLAVSPTDPLNFEGQTIAADPAAKEFAKSLGSVFMKKGYEINNGYPMLYSQTNCDDYTYPIMKNCYLNNPSAPYVMPVLKTWPDEYIDPATVNAFGKTPLGYTVTYRLDPNEAILIYGKLPPPGKYFGFQTLVFSMDGMWKAEDYYRYANDPDLAVPIQYLFDTVPPDDMISQRVQSLSCLSEIINNFVIERQSGAAFSQTRYFIITSNANMDRAVRRVLHGMGVPDTFIFTDKIPGSDEYGAIGPIGLGKECIDFLTAIRYAIPDAGQIEAAQAWRDNPPFTVMRIRKNRGVINPFPTLVFDERSAVSELGLAGDFQTLIGAVCDRAHSQNFESTGCGASPPEESYMANMTSGLGWVGPYCRHIGMNCLGDQQDANYYISKPLPLDSGELYAVIGTLGTQTGNATYGALSVNNPAIMKGAANLLNTDLEGSAGDYRNLVQNDDKFFVHFFARDCTANGAQLLTGGRCTDIGKDVVPAVGDPYAQGDPELFGKFMATVRWYICPGTERGPDAAQQLTPRILKFTKQ